MYRDVRYVVPFLVQFWLFASPVVYPSFIGPSEMALALRAQSDGRVLLKGLRWSLTGHTNPPGRLIFVSTAAVLVLLASGLAYFQKVETTVADVV
jgi:lipopolysaccharide transport system permease protein